LSPAAALNAPVGYTANQATHFDRDFMQQAIIVAFLALILFSLGSALVYLVKDRGNSTRTVKALTLRVGLSIALFLLLMAGHYFGFIQVRH